MMEIEDFWNYVKPFKKIEKGNRGRLNYGYVPKRRERGWRHNPYRRACRQIRKYGFDSSETWGLDYVIMRWLSDEFGGFFRQCGCSDDWGDFTLDGQPMDSIKDDEHFTVFNTTYTKRHDSFREHLKDLLENSSESDKKKIADFCAPRLHYLAKVLHGYPCSEEFKTCEDWVNGVNKMAEDFENGSYNEHFITHFFSLWD